jgi:serine/threonine protein kinase
MPTVRAAGEPSSATARTPDETPLVVGRYRLKRRLGGGAFGTVFAARDERLDRDVAVKILPRDRVIHARFEREARAAARLTHPGIVTLYEAAVDDEGAYLVSELVRGPTLAELLESGRMSDRDVLQVAVALCDALAHAHQQGVIHRDVKPSNVLVPARPTSAADAAKLTDFGVARVVGGDSLTHTGDVVGTPAYMAPEQAEGRDAGPAADLYSVALVVYEALTGVNPLHGIRTGGRSRRLATYLPPLRRQRRDLPRELGIGIDQALRPRPTERGELADLRAAFIASLDHVTAVRGVVAPGGWRSRDDDNGRRAGTAPGPEWSEPRHGDEPESSPTPVPWPQRGLAAAAAAGSVGWLCIHLLTSSPLAPVAAALLAAAAVLLLPRLGWIAAVAVLATLAVSDGRSAGGLGLMLVVGGTAILLVRSGRLWPLPAGAVLLGLVGLGGAWPAVVGRSGARWWQRAGLAAAGSVWLAGAGALAGHTLYARFVDLPRPTVWAGSPPLALHDVLLALLGSGLPEAALVWAVAAVVLPWLVRGRAPFLDIALTAVWAAATVSGTAAAGAQSIRGAVLGALAGALIALRPAVPRLAAGLRGAAGPTPRVP